MGDVGCPDLAVKTDLSREGPWLEHLFDSLRNKIMPLPDDVIVYPEILAPALAAKDEQKETWGYLGDQKRTTMPLQPMSRKEFVKGSYRGAG